VRVLESPTRTTDAQISDDQRLVATTTNDGGCVRLRSRADL